MRIGELSEKSGVSRDTIRFYERNGLITSVAGQNATNNYRDYAEDNLIWLEFFTGAREAGMSVADLRSIVEAVAGSCDRDLARDIMRQKISELKARAEQIEVVVRFLEKAVAGQA
ncbi:MerR family transcriptional regulator [Pararhodobacter oceanensis]|uniref:MerR family transcriptional regulator n=1 Tax=Pararhodobacter oceanensis TaxID=2172121 RepID=A0A2T8HZ73_9RHOB|nr:MerR family transcriptional regulator [Pararhodobacter oceanensis]PVH30736.1 MerR family transcriptional regulator [Pararhodobacter oceanensis]